MDDFISHLRTAHLALIVTCIAMLVAVTADTSGVAARVYSEIQTIEHLTAVWENNWLAQRIQGRVQQLRNPPHIERLLTLASTDGTWPKVRVEVGVDIAWCLERSKGSDQVPSVTYEDLQYQQSVAGAEYRMHTGVLRIITLDEFSRIWDELNELHTLQVAEVVTDGYLIEHDRVVPIQPDLDAVEPDSRARGTFPASSSGVFS